MDKWKEVELEKMKVGGNANAKSFLESQTDWNHALPFQQKYNTRAAALYRDKINTQAKGESWSVEQSSAKDYRSSYIQKSTSTSNNLGR